MAAYAVGAFAATYAVQNLRWDSRAWAWAALATVLGVAWSGVTASSALAGVTDPARLSALFGATMLAATWLIPTFFVVEEVAFRGVVDSHVHQPGQSWGWLTAIFVAALWGLWHLPLVVGLAPMTTLVLFALVQHVAIGVPLSFAWRRSGNLALPVVAHGLIDAVRDGLSAAT